MIDLKPGDYVLTSDIESSEMNDRIVEEMERQGFTLYGSKNKGEFSNIGINSVGDIVGGLDRCAYRQLTPAQILATPQWVPQVGNTYIWTVKENANVPVKVVFVDDSLAWVRTYDGRDEIAPTSQLNDLPTEEDRAVEEMVEIFNDGILMSIPDRMRNIYKQGYRKQPQPAEDTSSDRAWREGDIARFVEPDEEGFSKGGEYLISMALGPLCVVDDDGDERYFEPRRFVRP